MNVFTILSFFNILLSLFSLIACFQLYKYQKRISFYFGTIAIIASRIIIPAALFGIFGGYQIEASVSESAVNKMNFANFIFLSISLPIGWMSQKRGGVRHKQEKQINQNEVLFVMAAVSALTAIVFFYSIIYHGNWRQFPLAVEALTAGSGAEHYSLRIMMRYATGGLWIPSVFSDLVMIPAIFFLAYVLKQTGKVKYLFLLLPMWSVFFLFNLLKLQRSPVVYAVIIFVCVLIYLRVDFNKTGAGKLVFTLSQVIGFTYLIAAAIYFYSALSYSGSFSDALFSAYRRVFLVPAATPMMMFEVFPDVFDYRGIWGIFHMGVYTTGTDIGFSDVGYIITGKFFSPNSYFLSVGYSGMGWFGVAVVSLVFSSLVAMSDRIFAKYPVNIQFLLFACSFVGMMALTGVPFLTAIRNSGFVVSSIGFLFLLKIASKGKI